MWIAGQRVACAIMAAYVTEQPAALLALAASIQAFARINNLEHWMTDVIGGAIYGLLLLLLMITAHAALTRAVSTAPARTATAEPALT